MLNLNKIEKKWQARWEEQNAFEAREGKKKKFYVLEMFPYPSGSGLHMGHAFNYTIGDVYARFKRMQGFNVLHPMGFDSFGLPAENAAIMANSHPKKFTEEAISNFIMQLKALGFSYDWNRMIKTSSPEYYKWNQYFFLKLYEKGLVYRKSSAVNWCGKCNTVLANEQVKNGKCWRHENTDVETRHLEQWFIKTTKYADELLREIEKLDWPPRIKTMQENWIGKSEGAEILFEIPYDKKTNFVQLHGFTADPNEDFHPWLKKELESRGYKVSVPKLPNTNNPNIPEQIEYVLKNCKFDENTILLGHSLGSVVALKVIEKLNKPVKKLILATGFIDKNLIPEFDFEKIKKNVSEIKILRAENDSVVPSESADKIKEKIGGEIIDFRAQDNHICGKQEPVVLNNCLNFWPVFTTRPDTLFGVTFLVVSAQHSRLFELVTKEQKKSVEQFLTKIKSTKQEDLDKMDKEGVFTGSYAMHPLTKEKIPIYAGNFVVAEYGSGMVMAVPAHDQRDFEFAKKYDIPIKEVVSPLFVSTSGVDKVAEGRPFVERNAIAAILKHWSEDKYAILKWKKVAWHTLITGGVEKNQTPEEAAIAEIKEETGYLNPKLVKKLGMFHSKFFHKPKDENRFGHFHAFYFELKNNARKEISESESEKHEIKWLSLEEAMKSITAESHKYILKKLKDENAFVDYGILFNSEAFDELDSDEAKEHIVIALKEKGLGKKITQYKLRDWLVSRQRYWGTPIPIIYCEKCGAVPVPEKELPVKLPEKVKFGDGNPLATNSEFVNTICPKCKSKAKRETDTMDTFFDSSWYYLRYADSKNDKTPFEKKKAEYWMPVDQYIGGAEHAVMHLIYARFFTKALRDLGFIKIGEPFPKLFNQGMVHGEDGFVMSKSRGNVIDPLEIIKKYGADTLRLFLVSTSSPDKDFAWGDAGIEGSFRFVIKLTDSIKNIKLGKSSAKFEHKINKAIKQITENIENMRYNFAVIKLRELGNSFEEEISKNDLLNFLKLLAPFCPHIAEELWFSSGNKELISLAAWPTYDDKKINDEFDKAEQFSDQIVSDVLNLTRLLKEKQNKIAEKIFLYTIPNEFLFYDAKEIAARVGCQVEIFAVNDKNKYDPQGKSAKARPGKPAIFIDF